MYPKKFSWSSILFSVVFQWASKDSHKETNSEASQRPRRTKPAVGGRSSVQVSSAVVARGTGCKLLPPKPTDQQHQQRGPKTASWKRPGSRSTGSPSVSSSSSGGEKSDSPLLLLFFLLPVPPPPAPLRLLVDCTRGQIHSWSETERLGSRTFGRPLPVMPVGPVQTGDWGKAGWAGLGWAGLGTGWECTAGH